MFYRYVANFRDPTKERLADKKTDKKKMGPRVRSKVDDRWEKGVFVLLDKLSDIPVYVVKREED